MFGEDFAQEDYTDRPDEISVIIPFRGDPQTGLPVLFKSLRWQTLPPAEVIVSALAESKDKASQLIEMCETNEAKLLLVQPSELERLKFLKPLLVNVALEYVSGCIIQIFNPCMIPPPDFLETVSAYHKRVFNLFLTSPLIRLKQVPPEEAITSLLRTGKIGLEYQFWMERPDYRNSTLGEIRKAPRDTAYANGIFSFRSIWNLRWPRQSYRPRDDANFVANAVICGLFPVFPKELVVFHFPHLDRGGEFREPEDWEHVAKLFRWVDPKLDKLISYDPFLVKRARRAGLSAELVFNGVDLEIFRTLNRGRRTYLATTYGFAEYELALEVHQAVRTVGGKQFIAGIKPGWKLYAEIDFGTADHAYFLPQTNTSRLVQVLNDSVYVVGLTQTRGIERIVTEGAACGAIPIVLDSPLYRFWFGESVLYVDSKRSVIDQLVQIFKEQLKPKQTFIWRKYGFNKVAAQIFSICWRWVKCPSLRSALA